MNTFSKRLVFSAISSLVIAIAIGCGSGTLSSIQVIPAAGTQVLNATGQSVQFRAISSDTRANHPTTTKDVTDLVAWTSSQTAVATVNSTGLATAGTTLGTTVVTASLSGSTGVVTGTSDVKVTGTSAGAGGLTSIAIIPNSQAVTTANETAQFIAIGTYVGTAATTADLTNQATWSSSDVKVATVSSSGLANALSQGTTTITAIAKNPDGSVATGIASFTVTNVAEPLVSLAIIPGSQSVTSLNVTGQFIALGTYGGSAASTTDLTSQVAWSSSQAQVATISASGLATSVGQGATTITAIAKNVDGSVVADSATFSATVAATTEPLLSLTILPGSQAVQSVNETGQYIAIGTFSLAPFTRDLTDTVTWTSSDVKVATINKSGLATGINSGSTAITAIFANPDGSLVTGAATFTEATIPGNGTQLATLTIYKVGSSTDWLVTAPSSTGAVDLIHCGTRVTAGGSVCIGNYPLGSKITITATPSDATFGGWSSNCTVDPTTSNMCTVTLNDNDTVGAIFN